MLRFKSFLLFFLLSSLASCDEDMQNLLANFKDESELSKVTKRDSAGFLNIYTRDELEKMQVNKLSDILKVLPSFYLSRDTNNFSTIGMASIDKIPNSTIRLYINDHDMTSASIGSAFMMWGKLPIEYIDHIEIYTASSSIEFGNETASLIIKLYTKTAKRDQGSKIRVVGDNLSSYNLDAYTAQTLQDSLSLFAYANLNDTKRTQYSNFVQGNNYDINSDTNGYNIFANIAYKDWNIDMGQYNKKEDLFLGMYPPYAPTGGDLSAKHSYVHLTKKFVNDIKLQLSYDDIVYAYDYSDIFSAGRSSYDDKIFSAILEKKFYFGDHELLFGGFYKNKSFKSHNIANYTEANRDYLNNFDNSLNLYSLYLEDNYYFDESTLFVISAKGDIYRYKKSVKSQNAFVFRTGVIKNIDKFKLKLFYTKSYIPLSFYQLYNPLNTPMKANPNLNAGKIDTVSGSLSYANNSYKVEFTTFLNWVTDMVYYDPSSSNGYFNVTQNASYNEYQLNFDYKFNLNNKLYINLYYGDNNQHKEESPNYGVNVRLFNTYKKFDFYNELVYRGGYKCYDIDVKKSFDFTTSVKYHQTDNLSFGLRAENIFKNSYEQVYVALPFSIPVSDRKVWLNMEYAF